MSKDRNDYGFRINHVGAKIPAPSPEMIEDMAIGIHLSVAGAAAIDFQSGIDSVPKWESLSDDVKDYWIQGARCAYSVLVLHGGGSKSEIKDAD